jgi:predicted Fe-Mo cluster-binding NifX family protein
MKVCVPVEQYESLSSQVYGHFGSAPGFVVVDTETMEVEPLTNHNSDHQHGTCSPVRALAGAQVDAVIVGGIGARALQGLWAAGVRVYRSPALKVGEAIIRLKKKQLPEMTLQDQCHDHGRHVHGCGQGRSPVISHH